MVLPRDHVYDDARDVVPAAAVTQGQVALVNDVIGFFLYAVAALVEATFIYKNKQAVATKAAGSGTAILSLQKLYVDLATGIVTNVYASGLYFCGWAKEDADDDADTVLMNWDGTLWEVIT
jgi:hypothetical protein